MKTNNAVSNHARRLTTAWAAKLPPLLLLLTLPGVVQGQSYGTWYYTTTNDSITITRYWGFGGAVIIPSTINGLPVTSIGDSALNSCSSLTSITIPSSVINIGNAAFAYCSGLSSITIPDSVISIGDYAFYQCTSLTNVTIGNGVTSLGDYAFIWCYSLVSVTIGTNVTSIGTQAFYGCTHLISITISDSVTSIGDAAFCSCTSLRAITVDALSSSYSGVAGVLFNKSQTTLIAYPGGIAGSYMIPNNVTSIGDSAFANCSGLTSVTIPNSVTSIGDLAFWVCNSLTNVTIGNGVTSIGTNAFGWCSGLTSITIPSSVINMGNGAFGHCTGLTRVFFQGNAPSAGFWVFDPDGNVTVYYLPGTKGWGATFGGRPTALWIQVPTIQTSSQTQTAEAGSAVSLRVKASSPLPLFYLWYFNNTNLITRSTNRELELTNLQFAQSGAYSVVVSNVLGAITSAPALLNVIAPVERRLVSGVKVTGQAGSLLNVDYADSLGPTPDWTLLGSVNLASTSQYYFDQTLPLPPQRYYRAWQTGIPSLMPSLDLHFFPAITLTGTNGHSMRLDYINQFGPTDAWVTVATVTLTNTSQLYFDTSSIGQPARLYRVVPSP